MALLFGGIREADQGADDLVMDGGWGRRGGELRLLGVTLVMSAAALFALARLRFPSGSVTEVRGEAATGPLERLAARATFDDLAGIVSDVGRRVAPHIVVLQVASDAQTGPAESGERPRAVFRVGVRVSADQVVCAFPRGSRIVGLVGSDAIPEVVGVDPVRDIAVFKVRPSEGAAAPRTTGELRTPAYVAAVEGTRGGAAIRPLFLARTDQFPDPAWGESLLALGGASPAQDGSVVFTLEGSFVGLVVREGDVAAVVPAAFVLGAAAQVASGAVPPPATLGISLQRLSSSLARATGAATGAVVAAVDPLGPAARILRVGDVVEAIEGEAVTSPEALSVLAARRKPGSTARLRIVRQGERLQIDVPLASPTDQAPSVELGVAVRVTANGVQVASTTAGAAGGVAGLRAGDVITHVNGSPVDEPRALATAYQALAPGRSLLVAIRRGDQPMVVAVHRPPAANPR